MLARRLQSYGIGAFGVCAVTALDNRDKVVYQFLRQCLTIRVGIDITGSRLSIVIAGRYDNNRSHITVCRHVVEQLAQQTVFRLECCRCRTIVPVDEIQYIIALVCIFIVTVRLIDVSRVGACCPCTFGIVARVIVNTHHLATLLRLLLVNGRDRISFIYQLGIVLRTVGSFRLFLLLIRWQNRSVFFDVRTGSHAQTAKQYGL